MAYLQWFEPEYLQYSHEAVIFVRRRAERLLDVFRPFAGKVVTSDILYDLSKELRRKVNNENARQVYLEEVKVLFGVAWDIRALARIACCMAGGYKDACGGMPIGIAAVSWPATDCLLRVTETVFQEEEEKGGKSLQLKFVACNSRFAGESIQSEIHINRLSRWAKLIGVYHRRKKIKCTDFRLLVSCHVVGRLEKIDNKTQMVAITCDDKLAMQNRNLTVSRFRKQKRCDYGADYDCVDCRVGVNQCGRSCFTRKTFYNLEIV